MKDRDLIIGIHGIACALKNKAKTIYSIVATEEGLDELQKKGGIRRSDIPSDKLKLLSSHALQEEAKKISMDLDYEFQRVPSQIFMVTRAQEVYDSGDLIQELQNKESVKILCLDQVTDIHNGAAILRTAAFFNIDALVISSKNTFSLSPSFYRLASGAVEYVKIYRASNLSRFVTQLKDAGILTIGLSEHADKEMNQAPPANSNPKKCVILGAEESGISHAVLRNLDHVVAFKTEGQIKSLNVSVAAALAMNNYLI